MRPSQEVVRWIKDALTLHMAGRIAEAEPLYLRSLAIDQNLLPALHAMGLIRLHQGRAAEALAYIERALVLDPVNEDALSNRGLSLVALGRADEALASYQRVLQRRPDAWQARYYRAVALKETGRSHDALVELDRVLQIKPDYIDAWVVRANLLWPMGAVEQALESYGRALVIDPNMPEALASRANCLWTRKQDVLGAVADLERLSTIRPDFPYTRGALLHMKMYAGDWRCGRRPRGAGHRSTCRAASGRALRVSGSLLIARRSAGMRPDLRVGQISTQIRFASQDRSRGQDSTRLPMRGVSGSGHHVPGGGAVRTP
jgi:tetratricopeptide (TPR) repeat protein